MTRSFPTVGSGAGRRRAVGRGSGLWGPVWVVGLVALLVITGCAGTGSDTDRETVGADNETAEGASGAGSTSGGALVDWSEGLTQEEQVAEIEFVISVMQEHFGEDVVRLDGDEWDLERFLNWPGLPYPSHRASDHYYYEVEFDFSDVEANQETQEKALAVLEEIGLTPNGEQPTTYDEGRQRNPLYVAGGEDDHGRLFLIQQLRPGADISALFSTRHSDHQSMHEAYEANWEE